MTIQEFNKAMNGIDDRFLSAWEERQEQVISFSQDKEACKAKRSHRRLWVLVLAACLVIALAITAYATNFRGLREALTGTLWNLSDEEAAYVTPETAAAESEAGWSCAVTESLYTGEKIMLSVTVRAGDAYLLVPTYASPQDSVREIGLTGSETLQAYADRLGKTLLSANATMEFADWDTNGQGMFVKSWSTDEITLVISSEQRTRGPEALSGSCKVLVHNQKTGDKDFEVLPLNLTAAPEPEGDVKIFHPLSADSVPGMKFQDGTLTKTLRGYRLQFPFTVTDENTWKTYWKVCCEDLNLYGLLDFETGNMILDDIPTNDFSSVVIQILDDDSNIAGTLEVREYIG